MATQTEQWWWLLNPPQDKLREALEAEGFPPCTFVNRQPVFAQDVDTEAVMLLAKKVVSGTYEHEEKPKRKSRKRRQHVS